MHTSGLVSGSLTLCSASSLDPAEPQGANDSHAHVDYSSNLNIKFFSSGTKLATQEDKTGKRISITRMFFKYSSFFKTSFGKNFYLEEDEVVN